MRIRALSAVAILTLGLALTTACSNSSTSSSSGSGGSSTSASATGGADATTGSGGGVSAAQAVVAQYSAKPTRFPVDTPLTKGLKPGQKLEYLQCPAPFCALLAQLYGEGTKIMGIPPVTAVKESGSADSVQSALSSIQASKPAALLSSSINLGAVGDSVQKVHNAGIPIIGAGVMGGRKQGIDAPINGPANYQVHGKILADWATVTGGPKADIVWYGNPELDFTNVITNAFKTELAKNCPGCTVRYVDVPIATVGSTAPSRIVSDLQAHPQTKVALFASLETATGVPTALKVAGIKVKINGSAPVPANLQDMKNGGIDAAVGLDAGVLAFTQLDAAARLATGQPLTAAEKNGDIPSQLITKANLPGDVSKGFSAYPDFIQRFTTLWAKARAGK